jgi:hypothetical protein
MTAADIAEHRGAFAQADFWRGRCAKAEGHLLALVKRRDQGGDDDARLLSDLVGLIDEARDDLQTKDRTDA